MYALKPIFTLVLAFFMSFVAQSASAQQPLATASSPLLENKTLYTFGVVYNLADSMAYITELQPIAVPTLRNGQIAVQDVLSERLKRHVMEAYGVTQPVSAIFAVEKRAKAEKLLSKMRKQYIRKGGEHQWMPIPMEKFRFLSVNNSSN